MTATTPLGAALAVAATLFGAARRRPSSSTCRARAPTPRSRRPIGVTEVAVDYSSPGVKNRKIWGGVVPYDKVWRAGANSPTKITFSKDVTIDGKPVPAGSYTLLRHPDGDEVDAHLEPRSQGRGRVRLQEGRRRRARRGQAAAGADARAARLPVLELQRRRRLARSRVGEAARVAADQGQDRRAGGGEHQGPARTAAGGRGRNAARYELEQQERTTTGWSWSTSRSRSRRPGSTTVRQGAAAGRARELQGGAAAGARRPRSSATRTATTSSSRTTSRRRSRPGRRRAEDLLVVRLVARRSSARARSASTAPARAVAASRRCSAASSRMRPTAAAIAVDVPHRQQKAVFALADDLGQAARRATPPPARRRLSASSAARPKLSVSLGRRNTCARRSTATTSRCSPRKATRSPRPSARTCGLDARALGPVAEQHQARSGACARTAAKTASTSSTRLSGRKLELCTISGSPASAPFGREALGVDEVGDDLDGAR